jgi:hypothetical protein
MKMEADMKDNVIINTYIRAKEFSNAKMESSIMDNSKMDS